PDAIHVERRRRNGVDHAATGWLSGGRIAILADVGRNFEGRAAEIGTDLRPGMTAVARFPERVRGEEEQLRIGGREHHGRGAQRAIIRTADRLGRNVLHLTGAAIEARDLAAVDDIGIQRVGRDVAILFDANRVPIAYGDLAVVAAARNACGAALLLAAAQAIGK